MTTLNVNDNSMREFNLKLQTFLKKKKDGKYYLSYYHARVHVVYSSGQI